MAAYGSGDILDREYKKLLNHSKKPSIAVMLGTHDDSWDHGDEKLRAMEATNGTDALLVDVSCTNGASLSASLVEIVTKAERSLV